MFCICYMTKAFHTQFHFVFINLLDISMHISDSQMKKERKSVIIDPRGKPKLCPSYKTSDLSSMSLGNGARQQWECSRARMTTKKLPFHCDRVCYCWKRGGKEMLLLSFNSHRDTANANKIPNH